MRANGVVGTNYNLDTVIANNVTTTNFDSRHGYLEDIDVENMRSNNVTTTNFDYKHGELEDIDVEDMRANNVVTSNFEFSDGHIEKGTANNLKIEGVGETLWRQRIRSGEIISGQ